MFQVMLNDLCVEVDAETAADLKDPDYATRYLQAIRRELGNGSETSDSSVRDDLSKSEEEIQSKGKASSITYRWNHKAILSLLDVYQEYESKFETGQFKQGWKLISKTLNEGGINVSPQQCSSKMDTLKRRFKIIKDSHSKTGASPITWEYYSVMSDLFDIKSWAEPLQGAVSSTLASTTLNDMAQVEQKPGCSKNTPKKRKIDINEILSDLKMERQKRDEEKKMRLEEKIKKKEEYEIRQEQRQRKIRTQERVAKLSQKYLSINVVIYVQCQPKQSTSLQRENIYFVWLLEYF